MYKFLLFVTTMTFGIIYFLKYTILLEKYNYDIAEIEFKADLAKRK
ncbi:hypothetical protein [Staphylococcus croceilyticus]|nr:hypothetical protein [Staphylococcus croceilyticus]